MLVASSGEMRIRACIYLTGLTLGSIAACGGLSGDRESVNPEQPVQEMGRAGGGSRDTGTGSGSAGTGVGGSRSGTAGTGSGGIGGSVAVTGYRVPVKHRELAGTCDRERAVGNYRPYEENPVSCPQDGGACPVPESYPNYRAACVDYGEGPRCVVGFKDSCLADSECTAGDQGRCWSNRGAAFCTYDTCYSDATCSTGGPCACEGESGSPGNTCVPGNCQTDVDCGAGGYCSPTLGGCGNYSGVIGYYCHTPADTCVDDADCGSGYCMYSPEVGHWSCGYGQCVG